jgi:hypothetical protein
MGEIAMENLIGVIIFIVIVVASIAQKIQEQRAPKRSGKPLTRNDIPEDARRRLYGGASGEPRVAAAKTATAARPREQEAVLRETRPARQAVPPPLPTPGKELYDTLFGGDATKQAAAPQRSGPAATAARQQPGEVRVPPSRSQRTQSSSRGGGRASRETRRRQSAAGQWPSQTQAPSRIRRPSGPLALFSSVDDVRRGIILAEVLGPPKVLQERP